MTSKWKLAIPWLSQRDEITRLKQTIASLQESVTQQQADLQRILEKCQHAEAALQSSEELYALATRTAADGPWEWNLQTNAIVFSSRWKSLLGLSGDEFPNSREAWRKRVHPADLPAVEAALKAHLDGETARYELQFRLLHKDGTFRWVLSRGAAIRHANGKPYRMVGLDTDITRVKRVENIINQIVEGTSGAYGDAFFRSLVRHFAAALEVPCAFVTECTDQPATRVRTLAFWSSNEFQNNFEYDLSGTPCEAVIREGKACFLPSGVSVLFPREQGFEGYLGMPIFSSEGKVIGHLAFLDHKKMTDDILVDSVHRIFTSRAGAELERKNVLEQLTRQLHDGPIGLSAN